MSAARAARTRTSSTATCSRRRRRIAEAIQSKYRRTARRRRSRTACSSDVDLDDDLDQWKVRRQNARVPLVRSEPGAVRGRGYARSGDVRIQHQAGAARLVLRRTVRGLPAEVPLERAAEARALVCDRARRRTVFAVGEDVSDGQPAGGRHCVQSESSRARDVDHGLAESRRSSISRDASPPGGVSERWSHSTGKVDFIHA